MRGALRARSSHKSIWALHIDIPQQEGHVLAAICFVNGGSHVNNLDHLDEFSSALPSLSSEPDSRRVPQKSFDLPSRMYTDIIFVHIYIHIYIYMHVHLPMCLYVCRNLQRHVSMYVYESVYACSVLLYASMHIRTCLQVGAPLHVFMYARIQQGDSLFGAFCRPNTVPR